MVASNRGREFRLGQDCRDGLITNQSLWLNQKD